jgi:hypothetical protein
MNRSETIRMIGLLGLCAAAAAACRGRGGEDKTPKEAGSGLPVVEVLSRDNVEVSLRVSEVANTFYILDAVSGHASPRQATVSAYRDAWDEKFHEAAGLETLLAEYRALREKYDLQAGLAPGDELEAPVPVPPFWGGFSQESRFNLLVDRSLTWDEFWRDLELVMKADDRDRMKALVQKLAPAAGAMLDDCPGLAAAAVRAADLMRRGPFLDLLARAGAFYGIPGERKVELSIGFVMLPGAGEATHAARRESHIVVETPLCNGPDAALPMDVIFHEACHVLEAMMGPDAWEALAGKYFGRERSELSAGWWILHEALATALGQGVFLSRFDKKKFEEKWRIPLGLYTDPLIDGYARALLPGVEKSLAEGRTLLSMAGAAADAFARGPADSRPRPAAYLKRGFLVCDPDRTGKIDDWLGSQGSFGLWSFPLQGPAGLSFAGSHEALSGLIVAVGEEQEAAESLFGKVITAGAEVVDLSVEGEGISVRRGPRPVSGHVWLVLLSRPELLDQALGIVAGDVLPAVKN